MSIFLPFNFNPDSVTVQTGAYTIPAGKYAYVTVDLSAGGSFTIDGSTAVSVSSSTGNDVDPVGVSLAGGGSPVSYTVPSNYFFEGHLGNAVSGSVLVDGKAVVTSAGSSVKAGSGAVISESGGNADLIGYSKREDTTYQNLTANFWVPTGTQLNESGSVRYTVQLFNIP